MSDKVLIGTSGFYYDHWRGLFYPEDLPKSRFFEFYTERFPTVELNSTFYHMPRLKTTQHWFEKSPKGFLFSLKAYRGITHYRRLRDCESELYRYLHLIKPLKPKLGAVLFQLPPSLQMERGLLESFFEILPRGYRFVMEFRHESWLCDDIFNLMKSYNVALCINDFEKRRMPMRVTADFSYVRLHGPTGRYGGSYSDEELGEWAKKIGEAAKESERVFVYFNNDFGGYAVQNAATLAKMI